MGKFLTVCITALLTATLLSVPLGSIAASKSSTPHPTKPQTKKTQALSKATYAVFEAAQKLYDAKDYKGSNAKIDELLPKFAALNDYEKATYWNFKGGLAYAVDDTKAAMEAYKNVLRQNDLPELMRNNTIYAIAQLSFASGDYAQAIKVMQKWITQMPVVKPDPYMLIAQANYQLQKYGDAQAATLQALRIAKEQNIPPKESWLSLLRATFFEQKAYAKSAQVLEVMVQRWPKLNYWLQLSGLYGIQEKQAQQLAILRANYEAGVLVKESDQLNLARLYLLNEVPFPAVQVLKRGFDRKTIQETPVTLQLYAQALNFSKENKAEIVTLDKLANLTGESKHFVYLGQAQLRLGRWGDAAVSFRKASKAKNVTRPGNLQMMLGNALYNDKKYNEAKAAFQSAEQYDETVKVGATWVNFVDKEMQRLKLLNQSGT